MRCNNEGLASTFGDGVRAECTYEVLVSQCGDGVAWHGGGEALELACGDGSCTGRCMELGSRSAMVLMRRAIVRCWHRSVAMVFVQRAIAR